MNSERKLATILATDCVNFSKHMEENEELTLTNLNECRKIIDEIIAKFDGKIFWNMSINWVAVQTRTYTQSLL